MRRRTVVGEAPGTLGSRRKIKFPSNADVGSQFGRNLPFVADEGEEPPVPVSREERIDIAARLGWDIKKKTGHLVGDIGCDARLVYRCIGFREGECSTGAKGLVLKQVVVDAAEIDAKFDCVGADDLGPVVHDIDVGFRANPRERGRVSDERIAVEIAQYDAPLPAGELAYVHTRYSGLRRVVGSIARGSCAVAVMRHADARFR